MNITDRQRAILATIIEQYAEIAAPVGSVTLAKLFGVSSATIRSEMAKLEDIGLIEAPHTSAGRIPTDKGYRLYVNGITDAQMTELPSGVDRSARAIEAHLNSHVDKADRAIRSAVDSLAQLTGNMGFATIGSELYTNGIGTLFSQPEFIEGRHVQAVARLIDNIEPWLREAAPNQPLNVFIGSENPIGKTSGATLIISKFRSPFSDNSYIGVIGPTRQNYVRTMMLVRKTGTMLEEAL
ncbi:MAG: transcriptional regulator [Candidatus Saccharibacteria bacterium]|jgi:heat-inducible transcriptional repressor|nr:transcriptional regulator [Patescibacteria group bacterium]MCA9335707.1 transcriptional regulator [Candidatus Saccharibacteria bacterium]MCA9340266.1 transcriptional regulator [Candidatus Saccharibacteria bacterium]